MWYLILMIILIAIITIIINLSINGIAKKLKIYDYMLKVQEKDFFVNARFIIILMIIIMVIIFEYTEYPKNELFFILFLGFIFIFMFISNKVVKFLTAITESHVISKKYERKKILNNLENIEVSEFENLLIDKILPSLKYKSIKDVSIDNENTGIIVAYKNGNSYIILCNNINKKIGIKEVESAIAVKKHYVCDKAIIVTKKEYSSKANSLARENDIELLDKNNIISIINSYYSFQYSNKR